MWLYKLSEHNLILFLSLTKKIYKIGPRTCQSNEFKCKAVTYCSWACNQSNIRLYTVKKSCSNSSFTATGTSTSLKVNSFFFNIFFLFNLNFRFRSFEELALLPNGSINEAYRPLAISMYHLHLHRWLEVFSREQLLVVNGDQLIEDPVSQLRRIETFLGKIRLFFFNSTLTFPDD